jgi:secondary thiamine-phosphate synthase enzyme
MAYSETIRLKLRSQESCNITGNVENIVRKSQIEEGVCNVFLKGSTGSIIVNENDPMLMEDVKRSMEKVSASKDIYQHMDNSYSHIRAILMGSSQSIPITKCKLILGSSQNVIAINFDSKERDREVVVTIVGD